MTRYIIPSDRVEKVATAIRAAFREAPEEVPAISPTDSPIQISVTLQVPYAARTSLSLRFDGESVLLKDKLARNPSHAFRTFIPQPAAKRIEVRLEMDAKTYNLTAPISALGTEHALSIEQWAPGAPPRVSFDGREINRRPGLRIQQVGELPELGNRQYSVFLIDAECGPLDIPEPVDIYIDDKLVAPHRHFTVDRTRPVRHHAKLTRGLHRVVVVSRRRGWVLLDTDIVVDGVDEVRVIWSKSRLSTTEVRVMTGAREVFSGTRDQTAFQESTALISYRLGRVVIDGVELPDGLEDYEDEIRRAKEFSEAMVANYKAFLEAKRAVDDKKKRGDTLTEDERKIDEIDSYSEMQEWVTERKRAEDFRPQEAGKTSPDGESEDINPQPEDPYEELQKKITLEIHEPSHVEGNERRAREAGLDWEKLKAFFKALTHYRELRDAGKTDAEAMSELTQEEKDALDWGVQNFDKIKDYRDKIGDPIEGAEEEIQEYEAEIKFYEEVLKKLQEERDRAANPPVPERYLALLVHYYHEIRGSFDDLSEKEKEEMRSRLRALKAQVRDSDDLTDAEKADLTEKLDNAIAALD